MTRSEPVYFILNEATLPRLLVRALARMPTSVIAVVPFIPHLTGPFEALVARLAGRNVSKHRSGLLHFHAEQAGVPTACEGWIEEHFEFSRAPGLGDYDLAYRKTCHKYMLRKALIIFVLRDLARKAGGRLRTIGVDRDLAGIYRCYFQEPPPWEERRGAESFHSAVVLVLLFFAGLTATVKRGRLWVVKRSCLIAVDRLPDPRDGRLFESLRRQGHAILYVARYREAYDLLRESGIPESDIVRRGDGRMTLVGLLRALGVFVRDFAAIAGVAWNKNPGLAYALATLPYHRMVIRADLATYPCRFFWARDEYNTEHILRTIELRRVGSKSLGLQHGTPILGRDAIAWRFISFDTFFVSGEWIIDEMADRWPKEMAVKVVGSFGLSKEMLAATSPAYERSNGILFYASWVPNLALIEEMIRHLCIEFPDRTIWLKIKNTWREAPDMKAIRARLANHPNLNDTTEDPYRIMAEGSIVFSTPSTIIIEAMHKGLPTYCIEDEAWGRTFCFHRYPIIVSTVDEVIERAHAGGADYDWDAIRSLVPLDGTNFDDVIRTELGLTNT